MSLTVSRWGYPVAGGLLALVGAQSVGAFGGGSPTVMAPCSLVLVLPLFAGVPFPVVLAVPSLAFWVWAFPLWGGRASIPKRTLILFFVVAFLSMAGFVSRWKYGLKYKGTAFTLATAAISAAFCVVIAVLAYWNRRSELFASSLVVHWLLFAWVLTYAFPYLGETA